MTSKLPFKDNSIDAIYTSHTLEHIFPDRLPFVLSECRRVLKSGSPMRIVVPDIEKAIQAYIKGNYKYLKDKRNPRKMKWLPDHPLCCLSSWFFTYKMSDNLNDRMIGGHVGVFNFDLMKQYLKKSAFNNIRKLSFGKGHGLFKKCDFPRYKDCSIYVEATK